MYVCMYAHTHTHTIRNTHAPLVARVHAVEEARLAGAILVVPAVYLVVKRNYFIEEHLISVKRDLISVKRD